MKHIIISFLFLVALFSLSKFIFDPMYLYYEIWWLDIPMHIVGGFGVAVLTIAVLAYKGIKISYKHLLIAFLFVGIFWELYEHVLNMLNIGTWYGRKGVIPDVVDSCKDLVNGALGVSLAYLFIKNN